MNEFQLGYSVDALAAYIATAIDHAQSIDAPFHRVVLDTVFPPEVYTAMLSTMPMPSSYRRISSHNKDSQLDWTLTRSKVDLFPEYLRHWPRAPRAVWSCVGRALCSMAVKRAFVRRLATELTCRFSTELDRITLYPVPTLTRDMPGYKIFPHTDTHWKGITSQFYLPHDDSIAHVGTIFHERLADGSMPKRGQMRFSPNSGYAFAVSDNSWHSLDQVGPEVPARDSILLTYYVDLGPLRYLRNRGKRAGNFVANELRAAVAKTRRSAA